MFVYLQKWEILVPASMCLVLATGEKNCCCLQIQLLTVTSMIDVGHHHGVLTGVLLSCGTLIEGLDYCWALTEGLYYCVALTEGMYYCEEAWTEGRLFY